MRIIEAIILGIVQGITEWLPISSSGHLVLLQNLFKIEQPVVFDLILHLGSLLVVLIVFREDIKKLIRGRERNSLLLDATRLDFVGSSGIEQFLEILKKLFVAVDRQIKRKQISEFLKQNSHMKQYEIASHFNVHESVVRRVVIKYG